MSYTLSVRQLPLGVTPTHSDHTWNIALNDYSAYTDIRLVVDIYKNPYQNDSGSTQDYGKVGRLLIPSNQFGNCIFNVESIIYNLVEPNPRNMGLSFSGVSAIMNPYNVVVADNSGTTFNDDTSQATIVNPNSSSIIFSNGFNGGYDGFQNIYHINEYRLIFGIQYTNTSGVTTTVVPTNYSAYTGWTEGTDINIDSAAGQPYGIMIYPGVQNNKYLNPIQYYDSSNLNGKNNYLNTQVFDYQLGTKQGRFMTPYGSETIPMTIFNSQVYQTRFRTHYYKCPILVGFMYSYNPLFDNSAEVGAINFLQKTQTNNQYNYDVVQTNSIGVSAGAPFYSYLSQRIAYGIFKPNATVRTDSDVAVFLSTTSCNYFSYDDYGGSEIVQYKMVGDECFNDPVSFLFLTRQGIWDTYTFTKKFTKKYVINKKTYNQQKSLNTKIWNRQSYESSSTTFYGAADEIVTVDSGFVYQNDVDVIEELLMSPSIFMIMDNWQPEMGMENIKPYLIPCNIENKEVKEYLQRYVRIFQYTIELKQTPYREFYLPF